MKALTVGEVSNRIRQCPRQAIWSPKSRGRPKVHKQSAVARVRALFSDGLLVAPAARYNFGAKLEGMGNLEWGPEQARLAAICSHFSAIFIPIGSPFLRVVGFLDAFSAKQQQTNDKVFTTMRMI
jgi:hypothetical protein